MQPSSTLWTRQKSYYSVFFICIYVISSEKKKKKKKNATRTHTHICRPLFIVCCVYFLQIFYSNQQRVLYPNIFKISNSTILHLYGTNSHPSLARSNKLVIHHFHILFSSRSLEKNVFFFLSFKSIVSVVQKVGDV